MKLLVGFPGFPDGHVHPAGGVPSGSSSLPPEASCPDCPPLTANKSLPSLPCVVSPCLFNISSDPTEQHDLAATADPEILAEMLAEMLAAMLAAYHANRACAVAKDAPFGICPPAPAAGWGATACGANAAGGYWQPWANHAPPPPPLPPANKPLPRLMVGVVAATAGGLIVVYRAV